MCVCLENYFFNIHLLILKLSCMGNPLLDHILLKMLAEICGNGDRGFGGEKAILIMMHRVGAKLSEKGRTP